jgi:hypothetical protein
MKVLRTLVEFGPLSPAETRVLAEAQDGEIVKIGDGLVPPADAGPELTVRAAFLRYILLGGCGEAQKLGFRLHEKGLRLAGASIRGTLDLQSCSVPCDIAFRFCRFSDVPNFAWARIDNLYLNGSVLPGVMADWIVVRGAVVLDSVLVNGEVRLQGAKLGGRLDCDNALISNPGKSALMLGRAQVGAVFMLRGKARIDGMLNMTDSEFRSLADEEACWPAAGNLNLARCQYDGFVFNAPVSARARLRWLGLQDAGKFGVDFWPQPYEVCARLLREMGHADEARAILIEKERLLRRSVRRRKPAPWRQLSWLRDALLGITIRYGHKPMTAVVWLIGFWIFGSVLFGLAYSSGAFKPDLSSTSQSSAWTRCADVMEDSQLGCFLHQPEAEGYPRFNAAIYAVDTLVPVVSMNMKGNWGPDESLPIGRVAQAYLWIQILVGWALTFLTVAGFSGLVKSK